MKITKKHMGKRVKIDTVQGGRERTGLIVGYDDYDNDTFQFLNDGYSSVCYYTLSWWRIVEILS